ncbi:MAG: hypothetical protein JSS83_12425 [Cyanobacteria bacterium SZAS LIN-3]|nr:hypothetical protein [Cyanobacteria bacterium SZAS LIN-3]
MSKSFFESVRRSFRYIFGTTTPADKSFEPDAALSFEPSLVLIEQSRRQAAMRMAAFLVSRVEKKDYSPAVDELFKLTPRERVAVAQRMVSINQQHRSIITSLPRLDFSYTELKDGSKDVEFLQIDDGDNSGANEPKSFCFRQDYCFTWR